MGIKIKVRPEGREGVWLPDKESLKEFIKINCGKYIHCFFSPPPGSNYAIYVGTDWELNNVLEEIDKSDKVGLITNQYITSQHAGHQLSLIINNRLEIFDIGTIYDDNLEVVGSDIGRIRN